MRKVIVALFVCAMVVGCASPGSGRQAGNMSAVDRRTLQKRLDKLEQNQKEILTNMKELLRMLSRIYKEKY